ncbi:fasciclin-like arabinogalactan protein 12 [Prosopis cineraria]|uniref:fasciclin-like arabinogalactan protein 12 n=1 Tax=Prosopis cineraria TaxID=364024 RepID=UPI00240FB86D|nr:fasciclin-like arabinogalactan protein 12 [Prosopis cineraria]
MEQILFFSLLLLSSSFSSFTLAQLTPAAAPKPPAKPAPAVPVPAPAKPIVASGPDSSDTSNDDIIKILRKAKNFNFLIRLLKTTQLINQINSQLIATRSVSGLTILAPDDDAFNELKAGFLNSLDDNQKIELLQFHVLPVYVSSSNFDSLTNPVRTLAGLNPSRLQLNVTAYGNMVNISTGVVNTTVAGIVYTDRSLAIYHLNKVLLPLDFFKPKALAPAPSLALAKAPKADRENPSMEGDDDDSDTAKKDKSGAAGLHGTFVATTLVSVGVALVAATLTTSY